MYFLNDNVEKCGFYECKRCGYRFLSESTEKKTSCPLCEQDIILSCAFVDDESWI